MFKDPDRDNVYYMSESDYERYQFRLRLDRGVLKPIRGAERYTVTKEGWVYNIRLMRKVRPRVQQSRLIVQITLDDGRRTNLSLARLVLSHFKETPEQPEYLEPVYRDGDPMNVSLDNLEWGSRRRRY